MAEATLSFAGLRADAATPAKRLRVRGGYAATPQRSVKAKTDALDHAMVGLQAAERAISELQGVIAVRCLDGPEHVHGYLSLTSLC